MLENYIAWAALIELPIVIAVLWYYKDRPPPKFWPLRKLIQFELWAARLLKFWRSISVRLALPKDANKPARLN